MTDAHSDSFQIESLFRNAFERTVDRFWTYIVGFLLYFVMGIGLLLGGLLLFGINVLLYTATKSVLLVMLTGSISVITFFTFGIFLGSWLALATTQILISKEKVSAIDAFKQVQPIVWGYAWFQFLFGLFAIGIFFVAIPTLTILFWVWMVWSVFSLFVYIDYKGKGLQPLWISKAIVQTKFWGVFLRVMLIYVAYYIVAYVLGMAGEKNSVFVVLSMILGVISGPFILSYVYEMYKSLEHPKEVQPGKVWVAISIFGFLLVLIISFFTIGAVYKSSQSQDLQKMMEQQIKDKSNSNSI